MILAAIPDPDILVATCAPPPFTGDFREVSREVKHKVPLCNLFVDIAQKMGVETHAFGSSTGRFA